MLPVNYHRWQRSIKSYLKPGRCYAFCKLLELTTIAFKATKILLLVRNEIPVDHSFQSYQNPVNFDVDIPLDCSFQSYQNPVNSGSLTSYVQ